MMRSLCYSLLGTKLAIEDADYAASKMSVDVSDRGCDIGREYSNRVRGHSEGYAIQNCFKVMTKSHNQLRAAKAEYDQTRG
ncbi:unnamed protein product [Protopolystoma xenopodis]|uniref:Uncharacterized protein n=1 Tax=Protopolystoma xenopodis TaxID=117903 RepID=A0A3S5CIY7_9PLAT|nr:unnamed protein product [Protopolystoma xenopodis]